MAENIRLSLSVSPGRSPMGCRPEQALINLGGAFYSASLRAADIETEYVLPLAIAVNLPDARAGTF